MAEQVRVRRLTDTEGRRLQQIVRRGTTSSVRYRRAMMLLASAGGNSVPVIAQLVAADEDTVRAVIHQFNDIGLACLDPQWAGGRPRLISSDDEQRIVQTATTRPVTLGCPFTRWSIRKLADYLTGQPDRPIHIPRETLRCLLTRRGITFQRTKTWKESTDPDRDAKLDRIDHAITHHPDRTFAFDEFGPLGIRPTGGSCWAPRGTPDRLPATYHRTHGVTSFHGCYSLGDDHLWGVNHRRKGADHTLTALKSIRAARRDGQPIWVTLDNLSAHLTSKIRRWATRHLVQSASPRPARRGPTRSRRTSARCGSSPWPTPTIPTTPSRPARCTPTCAGATPTPGTPTSWLPSGVNAPGSVARRATAGDAPPLVPLENSSR